MSQNPQQLFSAFVPEGFGHTEVTCVAIAWLVSKTISPTVERPSPKRAESALYSTLVASFQSVMETLSSTETGTRKRVT